MSCLQASPPDFLHAAGILSLRLAAPRTTLDVSRLRLSGKATRLGDKEIQPDTEETAKLVQQWNAVGPKVFTVTSEKR